MFLDKGRKSPAGFTLSELIAMGAILGVVTVSFLNIQREQHKNKAMARYYDIMNTTIKKVKTHLNDYKKSKAFLDSISKSQVSQSSGYSIPNGITVETGKFLQIEVSNIRGERSNKKDIKKGNALIKDKLSISDIKLFYKRKFESVNDSKASTKEEHGFVIVEISFHLKTFGMDKILKRRGSINIVYDNSGNTLRTLSPGERVAKVLEDEVCNTKHGGQKVGEYEDGECKKYDKLAGKAIRNKSCKEFGGTVDGDGYCRYAFGSPCNNGISGFDNEGNAVCR